jgi:hypothetical protein
MNHTEDERLHDRNRNKSMEGRIGHGEDDVFQLSEIQSAGKTRHARIGESIKEINYPYICYYLGAAICAAAPTIVRRQFRAQVDRIIPLE